MLARLLSPLKNRRPFWVSIGHLFFQFLVILGQFLAAYIVARLVASTGSAEGLREVLPEAYAVLGFFVCMLGYIFFHVRNTTTGLLKGELMQIIRHISVGGFIKSRGHKDGIVPTGKTIALFQEGMKSWSDTITHIFAEFLPSVICLIGGLGYIAFTDIRVFIAVLPYLLITSLIIIWARGKSAPFIVRRKVLNTSLMRVFVRTILEKQMIQLSRKGNFEIERYQNMGHEYTKNIRLTEIYNAFSWWFSRIAIDMFRIGAVIYLGYMIVQGQASASEIVIVGMVFAVMSRYYDSLLASFQTFQENFIHIEELWKYSDALIPFTGYTEGNIFIPCSSGISIENMSFSYPSGDSIFERFSLTVQPGVTTAIVGRSGAGKSTLVKLILGLLSPTSGTIRIDGQDLATTALESYYRSVAYLPQEPAIFDGSIRENLNYALESSPPDKTLMLALKKAECDFVLKLPHGLDTEIGERGVRLSGGERQRLAIARILLQNPEIILLDEPTAALDSFSEEAVTRALHATFPGKTVVIIAHRLQTVKEASTIIVLGKNTILEQGSHDTLIREGGHYASMVDLQGGRIIEEEVI